MPAARRLDRSVIQISLLASVETRWPEFGEQVADLLTSADARLAPVRAGEGEDCLKTLTALADFHAMWAAHPEVEWRSGRQLPSAGWIRHRIQTRQGNVHPSSLSLSIPWDGAVKVDRMFREIISLFSPLLGFCHLFTAREQIFDPESASGDFDDFRRNWVQFQLGELGFSANPRLPNIGWGMVFGERFADRVDPQLLSSHGFDVDPAPNGHFVRVVPTPGVVATDFDHFLWRRMVLRGLLDPALFLIHDEPEQLLGRMGSA